MKKTPGVLIIVVYVSPLNYQSGSLRFVYKGMAYLEVKGQAAANP